MKRNGKKETAASKRAKVKKAKAAAYKKLQHTRKGLLVVGNKSVTRMIRVNVKFADQIAAAAKKKDQTVPEYTAQLASRKK